MQQDPNYPNQNINPSNQDPQVNPYDGAYTNTTPVNQTPQNAQASPFSTPAYINTPANNIPQNTEIPKSNTIEKIIKLIWFVAGFINVILIIRIIFLLFNAQPSGFSRFLYSVSNPFAMPFFGIFTMPGEGTTYFDTASLVAIAIYSLIAWGIVTLIKIMADKQQSA